MSQRVTAIYENGVLRPLTPLDIPEHSTLELDLHEVSAPAATRLSAPAIRQAMIDAGLSLPAEIQPSAQGTATEPLSDDRRAELGRLFSGDRPLGELISEDREGRG